MEENIIENKDGISIQIKDLNVPKENPGKNQAQIAGAIIIAGLIIAGAILLKGGSTSTIVDSKGQQLVANAKVFNQCLDSGKYAKAVADSKIEASTAGVQGTPKGFILVNSGIVNTIDGAEPTEIVKQKIDKALAGSEKTIPNIKLAPVSNSDFIMGNKDSSVATGVTIIEYADFQCPFCGKFFKETEETLIKDYLQAGKIRFVYRDFAFLGAESVQAAQAARCAGEQGKFWEYHDYLFNHQNGENQGNFSDLYLKSFAGELKLK